MREVYVKSNSVNKRCYRKHKAVVKILDMSKSPFSYRTLPFVIILVVFSCSYMKSAGERDLHIN